MLNRAQDKVLAKQYLGEKGNLSGMIGMQLLCTAIQGIVVSSILAAPTAFFAYQGFKLVAAVEKALRINSLLPLTFRLIVLFLSLTLFVLLAAAAATPFTAAVARYYLRVKKEGNRPRATTIFEAFDFFVHFALVGIVCAFSIAWLPFAIQIVGLILSVVILAFADSLTGYVVALVLYTLVMIASVVVSVYKRFLLWAYPFVQADRPDKSAREVIDICKDMTKGHIWDLIVFKLSFLGWELLGSITMGLANVLYVTPYYNMTCAIVYEELKGSPIELIDLPLESKVEAPKAAEPKMEGISGMYAGSSFPLTPDKPVILGRDGSAAQIVFSQGAEKISRRHCEVMFDSRLNKYRVTDFSSNGTYVGVNRLPQNTAVTLERGSSISLGNNNNIIRLV